MPHTPEKIRLARWHEYAIHAVMLLLYASGCAWLICHYFLQHHGAFGPMPNPYEGAWLAVHGAAAMIVLFLAGSLLLTHVLRAWALRRNRGSGASLAVALLFLAGSGYLLYYLADERWRDWIGLAHWAIGLGAPVAFVAHVVLGRRKKTRARRRKPAPHAGAQEPLKAAGHGLPDDRGSASTVH